MIPSESDPIPASIPARSVRGALGLLAALLTAQVGLTWVHGRMLNRQHHALLELRDEIQGLSEVVEHAFAETAPEEGFLAPAVRRQRPHRPGRRYALAGFRRQAEPPPEQDPALREIEAARQSGEKAVKDAKVVQRKLSIAHAAERAERAEKVDKASKGFFWASILTPVILIAAFAARGYIRRQRG